MNEHLIIEAVLAGLLVFGHIRHHAEVKALLDRLMARNLGELAAFESISKPAKLREPKEADTIPL